MTVLKAFKGLYFCVYVSDEIMLYFKRGLSTKYTPRQISYYRYVINKQYCLNYVSSTYFLMTEKRIDWDKAIKYSQLSFNTFTKKI